MNRSPRSIVFVTLLLTLFASSSAFADSKTLCVFDVSGSNGDAYAMMKDFQVEAAGWGVDFELKAYTNEKTAADDFTAGVCQAVLLTGVRTRTFNKFSSTIEAMGGAPNYDVLESAIKLLAKPKAAKLMKSGDYETVAIVPAGAVYLFVRDKTIKSIEDLAGKSIATLDFDKAAKLMVKEAGASMSAADVSTFSGMFNNGAVDACYAPASAYAPLELEKGLKGGGGVANYPLAQLTFQVVICTADFPEGFGDSARAWGKSYLSKAIKKAKKADKEIASKYWIEVSDADKARYDELFLNVRLKLRDDEKVFDKNMLKILRRIRCKKDNTRAECAEKKE